MFGNDKIDAIHRMMDQMYKDKINKEEREWREKFSDRMGDELLKNTCKVSSDNKKYWIDEYDGFIRIGFSMEANDYNDVAKLTYEELNDFISELQNMIRKD